MEGKSLIGEFLANCLDGMTFNLMGCAKNKTLDLCSIFVEDVKVSQTWWDHGTGDSVACVRVDGERIGEWRRPAGSLDEFFEAKWEFKKLDK